MRHQYAGKSPIAILYLLVMILISYSTMAQDEPASSVNRVDPEVLKLKIAEVEASTTLDDQTAGTLIELYRRTLTNLELGRVELTSAAAFAEAGKTATGELERIQRAMKDLRDSTAINTLDPAFGTDLSGLEEALSDERAALSAAETRVADLREQYAREVTRPELAQERLSQARKERDAALTEASAPALLDEPAQITEARRWHLEARAQRLTGEMRKLEQELLTRDARLELLEARQENADLDLERARTRARMLEDAIGERREAEAERVRQEAESAQQKLAGQHSLVRQQAAINVDLGGRLAERSKVIQTTSDQRDITWQKLSQLQAELDLTRKKLAIAGVNQALGQLLVDQRRALPDIHSLQKQIHQRKRQIADAGLEQLDLSQQRLVLRDVDGYIEKLTEGLSAGEVEGLQADLNLLLESRVGLVEKSIEHGTRYLQVLEELDLAQQQLLDSVDVYTKFLNRKLLWVRNTSPIQKAFLSSIPADLSRLFSISSWHQLVRDLAAGLRESKLFVLLLLASLVLGLSRSRFLNQIDRTARYIGQVSKDQFGYSIQSLLYTALAAIPLPLTLVLIGLAINSNVAAAPFSRSLAESLVAFGTDILIIMFFIDACREKGLLITHCGWTETTVSRLRGELSWFVLIFPIARLIGDASFLLDAGGNPGGLAVLGSVVAATALGILIYRLFTPQGGILEPFLRNRPNSLLAQTRPIWVGAIIAVLPFLIVLWLAGYNYTGNAIAVSFMFSFWLLLWLMILQGLLARWLMLGYQRLELKAAIERRDAARAARRAAKEAGQETVSGENADYDVEETQVDFAELNSDGRLLLKTTIGLVAMFWLWIIWTPIVPALSIMGEFALWSRTSVINGELLQIPVTLSDLLLAVLIGIATGAAAKGMPALLELVLMQRTNVTEGGRYTATTLLRYAIVAVGAIVVIGLLGISWSKAQWLVAALGVGIGFGLQEIVANFISGLVLLFERPIRVGDTVTVGDTSGVVTRIQIRATTIRDWDRRELLVPNKELITGRLLNWTLTDETTRLLITVGVAYGTDLMQAMKLVEESAREHKEVLDDPAPFVIFEGFGNNSLNLGLRAYLPSLEKRLTTMSELHKLINAKFAEAGISIAFPQRDVHLDTSRPLEIRMQPLTE